MRYRAGLLFSLFLLLAGSVASAKTINGRVLLEGGAPARLARVTLQTEMGQPIGTTVTDTDGRYTFGGLESKPYIVMVDVDGYRRESQSIDLGFKGEEGDITFFLQPLDASKKKIAISSPSLDAKAQQSLTEGQQLLQAHKYKEAIAPLSAAVAAAPTFAPGYDELGSAYFATRDFENAQKEWQQAVRLDPKLATSWIGLARLANDRHDSRAALQQLERAAAAGTDTWPFHCERGRAFYALGDWPQATSELNRALATGGSADPQIYVMLGNLNVKAHNFPQARRMFELYLQADPNGSFAPRAQAIVRDMVAKGVPEP